MHDEISKYIDKLIERLSVNIFLSDKVDLFEGQAGIVIMLYHYSFYRKDNIIQELADELLDSIIDKISEKTELETISVVLSICYLMKDKFIESNTSIFCEVDNHLFNKGLIKENLGDIEEKLFLGLYIYHRMNLEQLKDVIVWKERMKQFFDSIYLTLCNKIYFYSLPVIECSNLLFLIYLCSKFENNDYFKQKIDLIYKNLGLIIEIAIREEYNNSDKYLLLSLLKESRLNINDKLIMPNWNSATLMEINHFYLYKFFLDMEICTPKIIKEKIISTIYETKHINELLSILTPNASGLNGYIAGFAWALLQCNKDILIY